MDDLIKDIEAFRAENDLSEWQFGELALNDRHLIRQLRSGRDLRMSTVERLRTFMAEYKPSERAA